MPEVSHLAFQAPHRDGQTEDWFTYSYLHFKNRTALSRLNMSTSCCTVWCTLKYNVWLQAFWMYKMSHWENFNWTLFFIPAGLCSSMFLANISYCLMSWIFKCSKNSHVYSLFRLYIAFLQLLGEFHENSQKVIFQVIFHPKSRRFFFCWNKFLTIKHFYCYYHNATNLTFITIMCNK